MSDCGKCKCFMVDDAVYQPGDIRNGICARFPQQVMKTSDGWCGEFNPRVKIKETRQFGA